ncbi:MAG: ProQ/FINO family protein [Endozoicomonas sp.]
METPVIRRKRTFVVKQGKACSEDAARSSEIAANDETAKLGTNTRGGPEKPLKTAENKPTTSKDPAQKKKPKKRVFENASDGIALLVEHWPQLFSTTEPKPLILGIWDALASSEKISRRRLRAALQIYCKSRLYRQALATGGMRYDLDGKASQAITEEHQTVARRSLKGKKNQA